MCRSFVAYGWFAFAIALNISVIYATVPLQPITWFQGIAPTIASTYVYKLYISQESGVKSTVTLTNVMCVANGINSQCSTNLPAGGNFSIISGNSSQLTATDPKTMLESQPSVPFIGNQGCIFRDNLYAINAQAQAQANKNTLQALYNEFQAAKFMRVGTTNKGNQFVVTEKCVGYIVH